MTEELQLELETDPPKILEIYLYPEPILNTPCLEVTEINREIKTLIQNMFLTMYQAGGVGLSANQVGETRKIFVMDTSNDGSKRWVFINPVILETGGLERWKEGCLSFPNIFSHVKRPTWIKIEAMNEKGETIQMDLNGIDAICFQHELDHLNGITFYDHLSPVQKNLIKKKIRNLRNVK
jgi:peptide deformylase